MLFPFVADRRSSASPMCGRWSSSRLPSSRACLTVILKVVMDGRRCCAMAAVQLLEEEWIHYIILFMTFASCHSFHVVSCHACLWFWPRTELLDDYNINQGVRSMIRNAKVSRSHKIKLMCLVCVLRYLVHSLDNRFGIASRPTMVWIVWIGFWSSALLFGIVCLSMPRMNMLLRWGSKFESNDWLRNAIRNLAWHVMSELSW